MTADERRAFADRLEDRMRGWGGRRN
jgi:hypothetical protein